MKQNEMGRDPAFLSPAKGLVLTDQQWLHN
jgi:hypothetical protein